MKKRYRKMKKKTNGKIREIGNEGVLLELPMPVAEIVGSLPEAIRQLSQETGILLMTAAIQSECERIAGAKHSKNPLRTSNWWGEEISPVYYDRQKVLIDRPRLRGKDGHEIKLATFKAFWDPWGMRARVMKDIVLGISSRNYEETVEGFIEGYGIKKSSVSRHFVKATAKQMMEFLERDISGLDLFAIFIDGIEFKGQLIVAAIGIDTDGKKHVLGLWQGATENAAVCTKLLEEVSRLKQGWAKEYEAWCNEPLDKDRWVYVWADGVYSGLRAEQAKLCALVVIGVNERGHKRFLAIEDGVRESTQSWREVLLKLKSRGMNIPELAIGDGAMGFWAALEEVYPESRHYPAPNQTVKRMPDP